MSRSRSGRKSPPLRSCAQPSVVMPRPTRRIAPGATRTPPSVVGAKTMGACTERSLNMCDLENSVLQRDDRRAGAEDVASGARASTVATRLDGDEHGIDPGELARFAARVAHLESLRIVREVRAPLDRKARRFIPNENADLRMRRKRGCKQRADRAGADDSEPQRRPSFIGAALRQKVRRLPAR